MAGRVVVTDCGALLEPGITMLREHGVEVDVLEGGDVPAKIAAGRAADVMLIGVEPLTADQIEQMTAAGQLKFVIRCGVGYDVIDVPAATRHGVWVANVPDYCTDEVADHTLTLLLASVRRLPFFLRSWREKWDSSGTEMPIPRLRDLTLGLVGFGRIGRAVAERVRGFGARIIATDPARPDGVELVEFDELLRQADIVSLHCPLAGDDQALMSDSEFALMKEGAVLINTSRGRLIDSAALVRALAANRPAIVALDVIADEPQPDLCQPLLSHPRVLVTPHVAYYSVTARRNLSLYAAENVLRYLRGDPPWHVLNSGVPSLAEVSAVLVSS